MNDSVTAGNCPWREITSGPSWIRAIMVSSGTATGCPAFVPVT